MKKGTKKVLIILAIALGIAFLMPVVGIEAEKKTEQPVKLFSEMSASEKDQAIFKFINYQNYKDVFGKMNFDFQETISRSVKYPETLEFLVKDQWIKGDEVFIINKKSFVIGNTQHGEMDVVIQFRSENKLSQKVRNKAIVSIIFKGEEGYKATDFQIK